MVENRKLTLRESELIFLIKEVSQNLKEQLRNEWKQPDSPLDLEVVVPDAGATTLPTNSTGRVADDKAFDTSGLIGLTQVPYGMRGKKESWSSTNFDYTGNAKLWEIRDYGGLNDQGILSSWDLKPVYSNTLFLKNRTKKDITCDMLIKSGPDWALNLSSGDEGGYNPWGMSDPSEFYSPQPGDPDYIMHRADATYVHIEPTYDNIINSQESGFVLEPGAATPITLYVNNDPAHWYENAGDDYWESWPYSGPEGTDDGWARFLNCVLQFRFKMGEKVIGTADVKLYLKFWIGTSGQEYFVKQFYEMETMDPDGSYAWLESNFNPANWTWHGILDTIAITALIVAGFFTWGQSWWGVAAYGIFIAAELINIYLYLDENDPYGAGLQALFLVIPLGLMSKYGLKGVIMAFPKIVPRSFNLVKGIRGGVGVKQTLQLIKSGNKDMLKVLRALVESGQNGKQLFKDATKKMSGKTPTPADVADFRKLIAKNSDELDNIFKTMDDDVVTKILKEQNEALLTTHMRIINSSNFGQIIKDAAIVLTFYDTNLIWNLVTLNFGEGAVTDLPTIGADAFVKVLSTFGPSGPCDIISYTKDVKTNRYYNCGNVQAAYSAVTSNVCVQEGKCDTIPVSDDDFGDRYNIGEREGYKSKNFNLALRRDWVNGWRPDLCQPDAECLSSQMGYDAKEERKQIAGDLLKGWYGDVFGPAAKTYEENMDGAKLVIGGIVIEPGDDPSDELVEKIISIDPTTLGCIQKIAFWYIELSEAGWENLEGGGMMDVYIKKNIPCWGDNIVL